MDLPKYAFFRGQYVPYGEAKVGVLNHALNYGTAVFGGIRAYWNGDDSELYLFRPVDHYRRFLDSARLLMMSFEHTPESLSQITIELLRREGHHCNVYIRPLAYKSDEIIGVKLHGLNAEISIVAIPFERYISNDTNAHLTFSSWRRIDDNSIPARGKISGAYANSALIKSDAMLSGFDDALVLNQDGHISEGSAMNFFMVRGGSVITPPITENILEGITRRTVIELIVNDMKLPVIERPVDRTEVYLCDEVFLTGTAAQVTAVTQIDHRPISSGRMGPITSRIRELFDQAVRGYLPQHRDWNVPVYGGQA